MKRELLKGALALTIIGTALSSCQKEDTPGQSDIVNINTPVELIVTKSSTGVTTFVATETAAFDSTADLTADEIEFIYAVREDEKIARDLYSSFFEKYQLKTFENIAKAESNHIKATERLFDYYQIDYPAVGEVGRFEEPERQHLYDSLLIKGNSELEAFRVMAQMEESNIVYYGEVIKTIVNPNIKMVMENLEKASENHFKAAIRQITALGGKYTPALMTESQYRNIIAIGFEKGKRYMYKNNGLITNSGKNINQKNENRGKVNNQGNCEECSNGSAKQSQGTQGANGSQGKGYRGM